jgi:hypothetical protein
MFNVYGDGVFLDTVADNSPATLAEFSALGYDKVEARPVGEGFDGTEAEAEKVADKWTLFLPFDEIAWPAGFDNADEWEAKVMAEAAERDALAESFKDETENEGGSE